jgi:hypothetical protein
MSSTAPGFLVVDQHVARNPVARAIQRQRVMESTRNFRIRVYLLAEGEEVRADAIASAKVIAVAIGVLQLQGATACSAWRVMHGGLSALLQLCERQFKWRQQDAVAVEVALEHAALTVATAPAVMVQRAWVESEQLAQEVQP